MIYYLLAAMVASLALQRTQQSLHAALVFVGVVALHVAITPAIKALAPPEAAGYVYHGSACLLYAMAFVIMNRQKFSRMGMYLQALIMWTFAADVYGWVLWVTYQPHERYNNLIFALFAFSILILVTGGPYVWRDTFRDFVRRHLPGVSCGYGNQIPTLHRERRKP